MKFKLGKNFAFIGAVLFLFAFHLIFTPNVEYDHARNLEIAREMSHTGLMSYFGANFLSNPPLMYAIHALFIRLFGFHYFVNRMIDLSFWIGAMFILRKISHLEGIKNLHFLVGLSWMMIYATAIRSYSDVLFFSSLALLRY